MTRKTVTTATTVGSILTVLLLVLPSAAANDEADAIVDIAPSKLRSVQSSGRAPLVVDVRTPYEYDAGHIPGAVNIPHTDLAERLSEVGNAARNGVVLYCMRGPRARVGENILREQGIAPLYHLDGGLLAWKRAGYPVEKSNVDDDRDTDASAVSGTGGPYASARIPTRAPASSAPSTTINP